MPSKKVTYFLLLFSSECEQEIQWLKEVGFHGIVKKFKGAVHVKIDCSCMVNLINSLLYVYSVPYI